MGVATPIPRFPFIPAASYRVFWLFPINHIVNVLVPSNKNFKD
jgi:hypothetical protein